MVGWVGGLVALPRNFFGLVKMTSGLMHTGYSLPEAQAGKLTSEKSQGKQKFFKVREKSGNFVKGQGKS